MVNRFQYEITAADKSAKGVKSAKSAVTSLKRETLDYGKTAKRVEKERQAGVLASSGVVTQARSATGKLLATAPGLSKYTSVLGDVGGAAMTASRGVSEAAKSGTALGASIGGVAALAGGAVGIIASLAAGAVKLAAGWSEGGAQLSLLSKGLNYTTGDLQKFQAAGELFDIDKNATTGALGGFGATMNDSVNNRNMGAAGLLKQWGLTMKRGADGQIDNTAMLMDVAGKIAAIKNPYGQAHAASILGVSELLPLLRQGPDEIRRLLDQADKYAAIRSDADVQAGANYHRKAVLGGQLAGRAGLVAAKASEQAAEPVLDASLSGAKSFADGAGVSGRSNGSPGAAISHGADVFSGAVDRFSRFVSGLGQHGSSGRASQADLDFIEGHLRSRGVGAAQAHGAVAGIYAEGGGENFNNPTSGAMGIGQWLGPRKRELRRRFGDHPSLGQQADFLADKLLGDDSGGDAVTGARDTKSAAHAYVTQFMRPGPGAPGDLNRADAYLRGHPAPIRIALEVNGLPAGATVTAKSVSGASLAVGRAMPAAGS